VLSLQQSCTLARGAPNSTSEEKAVPPTLTPVLDMPSPSGLSLAILITSRSRVPSGRWEVMMITDQATLLICTSSHCKSSSTGSKEQQGKRAHSIR
jgi:hypothetical protein